MLKCDYISKAENTKEGLKWDYDVLYSNIFLFSPSQCNF